MLGELVNHAAKVPVAKVRVEDALLNSGLEYVILQPTLFMQNMAGSRPGVVQSGVYAEPWSSETRSSRVDCRDVAEVAALRLLCICAPSGQEEFFAEVGVPVAARTAPPPSLDGAARAAFTAEAQALAPKCRTELLEHA